MPVILDELNLLLKLIYESDNCSVEISDDGKIVQFKGRNNGMVSRGGGVHGASMPGLAVALGNVYHVAKDPFELEIHEWMPDVFEVEIGKEIPAKDHNSKFGHKKFDSVEGVRDALLTKEINVLLVSAQNHDYFAENDKAHPKTGKGATESSNCILNRSLLDDFEVSARIDEDGNFLLSVVGDKIGESLEKVKRQICWALSLDDFSLDIDEKSQQINVNIPVTDFLDRMKLKKVNYQGIIPVDRDGSLMMAHRRGRFAMGYATAGGHCSDPYHPEIGALVEFGEEFGLKLKEGVDISALKLLKKNADQVVYSISQDDFELTQGAKKEIEEGRFPGRDFIAEDEEFIPRTEKAFSIPEIRRKKIALRNIPSIEFYLQHCQHELQALLQAKSINCNVKIPDDCELSLSGRTKIPKDDFGIVRFDFDEQDDFDVAMVVFESIFGKYLKVSDGRLSIYIDELNPQQIIDGLKDLKKQHDFDRFSDEVEGCERRERAAIKIQGFVKRQLARLDTKKATEKSLGKGKEIDFAERSSGNLRKVKDRLRSADYLTDKDQRFLEAEGKKRDDILTPKERDLFEFLINKEYWLHHASSDYEVILDSGDPHLLDPYEVSRRMGKEYKSKREVYDWSGIGRNIFWAIGHESYGSVTSGAETALISVSLNDILEKEPEVAEGFWTSDHFYSYKGGKKVTNLSFLDSMSGVTHSTEYSIEGGDGEVKKYIKSTKVIRGIDGEVTNEVRIEMGDEVFVAQDIIPFMAYRFIEHLRCLGVDSSQRINILKWYRANQYHVEYVMGMFFTPYNFILHNDTKFRLNNPNVRTKIMLPEDYKKRHQEIEKAIIAGDLEKLKSFMGKGYFFGHYYKNNLENKSSDIELLIVIAIKAKQFEIAKWMKIFYHELFVSHDPFAVHSLDADYKYNAYRDIVKALENVDDMEFYSSFFINSDFVLLIQESLEAFAKYCSLPSLKRHVEFLEGSIIINMAHINWSKIVILNIILAENDLDVLQFLIKKAEENGQDITFLPENILRNIAVGRVEVAQFLTDKYKVTPSRDEVIEKVKGCLEDKVINPDKINDFLTNIGKYCAENGIVLAPEGRVFANGVDFVKWFVLEAKTLFNKSDLGYQDIHVDFIENISDEDFAKIFNIDPQVVSRGDVLGFDSVYNYNGLREYFELERVDYVNSIFKAATFDEILELAIMVSADKKDSVLKLSNFRGILYLLTKNDDNPVFTVEEVARIIKDGKIVDCVKCKEVIYSCKRQGLVKDYDDLTRLIDGLQVKEFMDVKQVKFHDDKIVSCFIPALFSEMTSKGVFNPKNIDEVIEFAKNCDEDSASKIFQYWNLIPRKPDGGYLLTYKDIDKISFKEFYLVNSLDRDSLGEYLYIFAMSLIACKLVDESFFDCDSSEIRQKLHDESKKINQFSNWDKNTLFGSILGYPSPDFLSGLARDGFNLNPNNVEFNNKKDFVKWFFTEYKAYPNSSLFFKSISDENFVKIFNVDPRVCSREDALKLTEFCINNRIMDRCEEGGMRFGDYHYRAVTFDEMLELITMVGEDKWNDVLENLDAISHLLMKFDDNPVFTVDEVVRLIKDGKIADCTKVYHLIYLSRKEGGIVNYDELVQFMDDLLRFDEFFKEREISIDGVSYKDSICGTLCKMKKGFKVTDVNDFMEFVKNCDENSAFKIFNFFRLAPRWGNSSPIFSYDIKDVLLTDKLNKDDLGDNLHKLAVNLIVNKIIDEKFFESSDDEIKQNLQNINKYILNFFKGEHDKSQLLGCDKGLIKRMVKYDAKYVSFYYLLTKGYLDFDILPISQEVKLFLLDVRQDHGNFYQSSFAKNIVLNNLDLFNDNPELLKSEILWNKLRGLDTSNSSPPVVKIFFDGDIDIDKIYRSKIVIDAKNVTYERKHDVKDCFKGEDGDGFYRGEGKVQYNSYGVRKRYFVGVDWVQKRSGYRVSYEFKNDEDFPYILNEALSTMGEGKTKISVSLTLSSRDRDQVPDPDVESPKGEGLKRGRGKKTDCTIM